MAQGGNFGVVALLKMLKMLKLNFSLMIKETKKQK